jgi:hypothetical protein
MAWWTGQPVYGSNPVSKFIRENFAYLKTYVDYIVNSGVTTADLAAVHATPPTLASVVNITVNTAIGATDVGLGGGYNISGGITLTINGAFSAPLTQIFFGAGTVVFSPGSVDDVYPQWFGAVGDAITNDSAAIQKAINSLPPYGRVNGLGLTYNVTSTTLKSYMRYENFNFITRAGATDMVSPVTVGSNTTPAYIYDVIIRNVHVNGNRINQIGIGASEDGGRHGYRLLGHIDNLLIENCSAILCASDGMEIYSGLGGGTSPRKTNITIRDCRFNWNRRHGISGDSIDGLLMDNVETDDNGQDLNVLDPLTSGGRGCRAGGLLYGMGLCMEGYGINSDMRNIAMRKITSLRNVRHGILFYDIVAATDVGFFIRENIVIEECTLDNGNGVGAEGQVFAIEFTSTIPNKALGPIYQNISLSNNNITGELNFRACNKVTINGGAIANIGAILGGVDYATNVNVGDINRGGITFYPDANSSVYYFQSIANPAILNGTVTLNAGAVFDFGETRTLTYGLLRIICLGQPLGGTFAVDVYLRAGAGVSIVSIYNGAVVDTAGIASLQIIDTAFTWQMKNTLAAPYTLSYTLIL